MKIQNNNKLLIKASLVFILSAVSSYTLEAAFAPSQNVVQSSGSHVCPTDGFQTEETEYSYAKEIENDSNLINDHKRVELYNNKTYAHCSEALLKSLADKDTSVGIERTFVQKKSPISILYIPNQNLFIPTEIGKLKVGYDGKHFLVIDEKVKKVKIEPNDVSKEIRNIRMDQLYKSFRYGYFHLSKLGGDYNLKYNPRICGGGPIAGAIGYWATKAVSYTALVGGTGAALVTAGGAMGLSVVVVEAGTGAVVSTAAMSTTAVGTSGSLAVGAVATAGGASIAAVSGLGGAISTGAAAGTAAATATSVASVAGGAVASVAASTTSTSAAVLTVAGSAAGPGIAAGAAAGSSAGFVGATAGAVAGGVEALSLTIGGLLTACPFLP